MSYVVAVTGKGGVGKSTLAALLVRMVLNRGIAPVLAVDADANNSLAPMLGLSVETTISEIREEVLKEKSNVTGISKERILDMKLQECLLEAEGFDLLTMGRPEGPTCYCYVNNILRGALSSLRSNYGVTIVDNEAGMEHLSRMNTDSVDCMVFVTEPTVASAQAVKRIAALADTLPVVVRRKVLVWNKVKSQGIPEMVRQALAGDAFDETVVLPADEGVEQLSVTSRSVFSIEIPEPFLRLVKACGVPTQEHNLAEVKG